MLVTAVIAMNALHTQPEIAEQISAAGGRSCPTGLTYAAPTEQFQPA